MQIDLSEQFLSACEDDVHVVVYFLIVCDLVVDYPCVRDYAFVANLRSVNLCMHKVSVQVIEFVQVKGTSMIRYDVEEEHLVRVSFSVAVTFSAN